MSETAPISYIHDGDHFLQSALLLPREQRRVLALDGQVAALGDWEGVVADQHRHLLLLRLRPVHQRQLGTLLQRLHALLDERDESTVDGE